MSLRHGLAALALLLVVGAWAVTAALPSGATGPTAVDPARATEGPVAVAVRYVQEMGSADLYDPEKREDVLDGLLLDPDGEHGRAVRRAFDEAATVLRAEGRDRVISRNVPAGVEVVRRDGDEATVAVWTLSLFGDGAPDTESSVSQSWSTESVKLRRTRSGWRVVSGLHEDGPTPVGSPQEPAAPGVLQDADARFRPVDDVR